MIKKEKFDDVAKIIGCDESENALDKAMSRVELRVGKKEEASNGNAETEKKDNYVK